MEINLKTSRLVLLSLVLIVSVTTVYVLSDSEKETETVIYRKGENLLYKKYDENGKISNTIAAKSIYQEEELAIKVSDLKLDIFTDTRYELTANSADWFREENILYLKNGVSGQAKNEKNEYSIQTENLLVDFKTKIALGEDIVYLTNNGSNVRGKGIKIDFNKKNFNLFSEVSGFFKTKQD
ncbi:MAG: LPS export ABC transporter periplasmic protein LptC [Pseudomonadota bacterium]|nr:LPS export ABC transporter periplasmic protein LptC [Pseudomonadota bacterium]